MALSSLTQADSVSLLMNQVQVSFERGSHIEDLLLGLITLSVAGWAFLHARGKKLNEEDDSSGRLIFTIFFSLLVGTSYNMVYIMMMSNDITTLIYENRLSETITQFRTYYHHLRDLMYPLYFVTGTILPVLSVVSLVSVFLESKSLGAWKKPGIRIATVVFILLVGYTTWLNLDFSGQLFECLKDPAAFAASH